MATSSNNIITHGLSGTVGDMLVFSQRGGKTIVSKIADRSNVQQTEKQKQTTQRFQEAVIYAKSALADPDAKQAYADKATGNQTAYNVAIADLFNAPEIEQINMQGYTGKPGDTITVRATDDFKVKQVTVAIFNADGSLVEQGDAQPSANSMDWVYKAMASNGDLAGDKIVIRASDLPGNTTESQQII